MGHRHRRLSDHLIQLAFYGTASVALACLAQSGISEALDLRLYDAVSNGSNRSSQTRHPITVVGIDEGDISRYGWPIDDAVLCRAIDHALQADAAAIGLDLYRDQGVGQGQACLRERIQRHPNLVAIFNAADGIPAPPGTPPTQQAFNDLVVDADGVIRRDLVHVSGQTAAVVSLPVRLAVLSGRQPNLLATLSNQKQAETLGPWLAPQSGGYRDLDAAGFQRLLPFPPPDSIRSISLRDLADGQGAAARPAANDIVLIGSTAPSLKDLFEIPHSRFAEGRSQLRMPGVTIHALRTLSLLKGLDEATWQLRTPPPWSDRVFELMAVLAGITLGERIGTLRRSVIATAMATGGLAISGVSLLWFQGMWCGIALPLISLPWMAGVGWLRRGAMHQRQKQQIERLLGQTTSPAVARQLWEQRDTLLRDGQFEGKQVQATVLFTDTQDFTGISEQLTPAELLAWLNRGMGLLVTEITNHGGVINKFTGDGILAVFGAPISQGPRLDARNAVNAALAIEAKLKQLNQQLSQEQAPPLKIRIGLHTGPVIVGSMGSSARLEYTVMGDTVNCASRLESLARVPPGRWSRTLLSQDVLTRCQADDLLWNRVGRVQVKGRRLELDVIELMGTTQPSVIKASSAPAEDRANGSDPDWTD